MSKDHLGDSILAQVSGTGADPLNPKPRTVNPIHTLLTAVKAHGLECTEQARSGPTRDPAHISLRTAHLVKMHDATPHPIYQVIRNVLIEHAVSDKGLAGGALEFYPLKDGRVFSVTWVGREDDPDYCAILSIAPMGSAW